MRSSSRARVAFLLLYGALLAWQLDRWCFTPHGLASTWAGRHAGRTASAGSPRGLSQTFLMGADGLDGVWLRPTTDGRQPAGELLVDLLQVYGDARVRVERVVVSAADVVPGAPLHVPFRPIRHSRGQSYQLDLRHLHAGRGPAIEFATTRDDALRRARFFVDGAEQWGDLVFETGSRRATLPYWLHEILQPWPSWTRGWPVVAGVVLLFNVALAWACAQAVGYGSAGEDRRAVVAAGDPGRMLRRGATAAVACVVAGGLVAALWPRPRARTLDLIEALPDARLETTWASLHEGISPEPVVFAGRVRRAIVAMPTSRITWTVDVPKGAFLRVGAAMRPDVWLRESDGIQMRIAVEHARGRTVGAELTLFPMGVPAHRALFPVEVPIHPWAGQRVTIALEATPERWGNAVNDVPVWVEPRIEWPRTPGVGEARIVAWRP